MLWRIIPWTVIWECHCGGVSGVNKRGANQTEAIDPPRKTGYPGKLVVFLRSLRSTTTEK